MQVKMGKRVSETGSPGVIWSDFRPLQLREEAFQESHKVLTYVEYRAVSGVFQNIDPHPLSP
jgi:hypothetical protein